MPDLFDLVLQLQLASLQFSKPKVVCAGTQCFMLNLFLESLMSTLEFRKMGLQGHAKPPNGCSRDQFAIAPESAKPNLQSCNNFVSLKMSKSGGSFNGLCR